MTALVRATNVGIKRASCRAMSHSLLIRSFNAQSVEEKKAKVKDEKKKANVRRVEGKERFAGYADYVDRFNEEVKEAEKKVDYDETFKSLAVVHVPCAIGGKITISFLRKGQADHYEITLKEIDRKLKR